MASDERAVVSDGWVDVPARGLVYHLLRSELAAALASQDLHIVTVAEKRVLEAVSTVERASLEYYLNAFGDETGWGAVSGAELARRESVKEK